MPDLSILNGPKREGREVGGAGVTYNVLLREGRPKISIIWKGHRFAQIDYISTNKAIILYILK